MKEVGINEFKDIFGNIIKEGDIVARAIHSSHTFHRVVKITNKGVRLSRGNRVAEYQTWWYEGTDGSYVRHDQPITQQYNIFSGGLTPKDTEDHTHSIYIKKDYLSLVLVTNKVYNKD